MLNQQGVRGTPRFNRQWHSCIMLTVALLMGVSAPGLAQISPGALPPDSLVRMLNSPDWQVRAEGVVRLNLLPVNRLPSDYAETIIPLFEREAIAPDTDQGGEGYGEYQLAVMQGVVRLRDPRSLRGLALLGVRMSREAQEFVASQGRVSIPYLDEAWARGHSDAVATTWAYMLGRYQQALSRGDRLEVIARLFAVASENPRAFNWAALTAPLPEAVPVVEDIAAHNSLSIVRQRASEVLKTLRADRDQLSPRELLRRVSDWLDAVCLRSNGARAGACQTLGGSVTRARGQLETNGLLASRPALQEIIRQADQARAAGGLTGLEYRILVGNAEHLSKRER